MDYKNYLSPFSYRYGSEEMREIFSEETKVKLWRKLWVSLAKSQKDAGLLSDSELEDLINNQENIDIDRISEIEKETKHDVVAGIKEFAEKAAVGGGKIHLGATSMDIVDNTDAIRMNDGLKIVEIKIKKLLELFSEKIEQYVDTPCLGYTHLQAAEPTTVGYRFAFYAQDLLMDLEYLRFIKTNFKSKGFKGAVGTSASYTEVLRETDLSAKEIEQRIMDDLGLEAALISTQVYSRKMDYLVISLLASISSTFAKFAGDLRILQSHGFNEWAEPFGDKQVGSSAMPFKKNPLNSEKICSLARFVTQLPAVVLENASLSYLERTLDDSANKRIVIPESFLAVDEILNTAEKIIKGIVINEKKVDFNLKQFIPFAATESIILEAVKNGADRQEMHEVIREIAMKAWDQISEGRENPMVELLNTDSKISKYLNVEMINNIINNSMHIGDAPERAKKLVQEIKTELKK